MQEIWIRSLGREDPLEKKMATRSSILAWRILWTEEPGGLQSTGSQKSLTQLSNSTTASAMSVHQGHLCPSGTLISVYSRHSVQGASGLKCRPDILQGTGRPPTATDYPT